MKKGLVIALTGITLFAAPAVPTQLIAQDHAGLLQPQKHHTHYKVVDPGTFGGPSSHQALGAHILNNSGMFTGFADTLQPDRMHPMVVGMAIASWLTFLCGRTENLAISVLLTQVPIANLTG